MKKNIYQIIASAAAALLAASCASQQNNGKGEETRAAKPETKQVFVSVDAAKEIGKIKPLNGVNFGPKISTETAGAGP